MVDGKVCHVQRPQQLFALWTELLQTYGQKDVLSTMELLDVEVSNNILPRYVGQVHCTKPKIEATDQCELYYQYHSQNMEGKIVKNQHDPSYDSHKLKHLLIHLTHQFCF